MAKKKDVNIDELDDESGKSGKLVSILVAMLIIVIWLVIFALLIKMNVGGIGSSLRPYLKNVPVVNKILPAATDEEIQEETKYAIALGSIETIEDVPVSEIKYVHAKEVINLRGNVIPLIRLRELLDVPGEPEESDNIVIVIVRKGDKLAGLVVDNLIGQMEIVIKSLGKYININRMISGATILGDGSVALIIDANTLV